MIKIIREQEATHKIGIAEFRSLERTRSDFYDGVTYEKGGTSIPGKPGRPSPSIAIFSNKGYFDGAKTILDYGAGTYARNSDFLRRMGFKVYAYDPFNGVPDVSGYGLGEVSNQLPEDRFDIVFSSFVLNVLSIKDSEDAIALCERFSLGKVLHIVRNKDLFDDVYKSLQKGTNLFLTDFFHNEYGGTAITPEHVYDFCCYGARTDRQKFQRILTEDIQHYKAIISDAKFVAYQN